MYLKENIFIFIEIFIMNIIDWLDKNKPWLIKKNIRILDCANKNITCLNGISSLENLFDLILYHTQVEDISPLYDCKKLSSLDIRETKVKTLRGIEQLTELNYIYLPDNCNISGLEQMPRLVRHFYQKELKMAKSQTNLRKYFII